MKEFLCEIPHQSVASHYHKLTLSLNIRIELLKVWLVVYYVLIEIFDWWWDVRYFPDNLQITLEYVTGYFVVSY